MVLASKRYFWLGWSLVLVTNMAVVLGVVAIAKPLSLIAVALAVFAGHMAVTLIAVVARAVEMKKKN